MRSEGYFSRETPRLGSKFFFALKRVILMQKIPLINVKILSEIGIISCLRKMTFYFRGRSWEMRGTFSRRSPKKNDVQKFKSKTGLLLTNWCSFSHNGPRMHFFEKKIPGTFVKNHAQNLVRSRHDPKKYFGSYFFFALRIERVRANFFLNRHMHTRKKSFWAYKNFWRACREGKKIWRGKIFSLMTPRGFIRHGFLVQDFSHDGPRKIENDHVARFAVHIGRVEKPA